MSTEENKALSRKIVEEGFNKGNLAVVDQTCAANLVNHNAPPGAPPGLESIKQAITMYRTAFPDITTKVEKQIAEGDRVVTQWSSQG
ncbi:MAG: ester cyclase, partial [Chloroflexota bacterium]|nr:ester cyclase [Chloroflexota bacterium]